MKKKRKGLRLVGFLVLVWGVVILLRRSGKDIRIRDYL